MIHRVNLRDFLPPRSIVPRSNITRPFPFSCLRGFARVYQPETAVPKQEPGPSPEINLSSEQKGVLNRVLGGESVFFTGPSGTGKSVLLKEIIRSLRSRGSNVAVTASTGIAAVNIEGGTLHAFSGIGPGDQHADYLIRKAQNASAKKRWSQASVLVIDEISMINAKIFDVVNQVGKAIRKNSNPFGGLQLVVCGDFFQLPPVPDKICRETGIPVAFAFEAQSWDEAVPTKISLTKVFRQKEPKLVQLLNELRLGVVSDESLALFQSLSRKIDYSDGIRPTEIFPLRSLADAANDKALNRLNGERVVFRATDEFYKDAYGLHVIPQWGRASLDRVISDTVELRVGAQVMSVRNMPGTNIVNGSVGIIEEFLTPQEARSRQKASSVFSDAIPEEEPPKRKGKNIWENKRWPMVKFQDETRLMITPYCFTHKNALGMVEASRWQMPLILAWALTVHKAQGQTLSRVKIDLQGTFEYGQAYVALSRCTSLEGLEVHNFSPDLVAVHPTVQQWAGTLSTISDNEDNES